MYIQNELVSIQNNCEEIRVNYHLSDNHITLIRYDEEKSGGFYYEQSQIDSILRTHEISKDVIYGVQTYFNKYSYKEMYSECQDTNSMIFNVQVGTGESILMAYMMDTNEFVSMYKYAIKKKYKEDWYELAF